MKSVFNLHRRCVRTGSLYLHISTFCQTSRLNCRVAVATPAECCCCCCCWFWCGQPSPACSDAVRRNALPHQALAWRIRSHWMCDTATKNYFNKWSKWFDKKAASLPHTDGSIVFARWRQCARSSNAWFRGPTRVHTRSRSVQPFLQGSRLCKTDDRQTDHTTPSVTIGRIYAVLRCGLKT